MGTGEVRYISEDGDNAAVKLDGGSRQEVWLPVEVLSRLSPADDYGLPAGAKEAYAFAFLGYCTLMGIPSTVPSR